MEKNIIYLGPYKVVKIMRVSGRRKVLRRGLSLEEAKRVVNSYPDSSRSIVVFMKQYRADKYFKDSKEMYYDLISPDGFSFFQIPQIIAGETLEMAQIRLKALIYSRYGKQGYYSANIGRLSLDEAINKCQIIQKSII